MADIKLKEHVNSMLLAAAEAVGPQSVASLLYKRAAAHKNPKVRPDSQTPRVPSPPPHTHTPKTGPGLLRAALHVLCAVLTWLPGLCAVLMHDPCCASTCHVVYCRMPSDVLVHAECCDTLC